MWPRLLFDLLPHFARLVPMADKFFATRSAGERAQEAALAALAEGVREDLGQVTKAHAGLSRQLQEQSAELAEVGVAVARARMGVESVEARIAKLEKTAGTAMKLLFAGLVLLAGTLVLLGVVLHRLPGR